MHAVVHKQTVPMVYFLFQSFHDSPIIPFVEHFEKIWIGAIYRTKRKSAFFLPDLWKSFECAQKDQKQTTNNLVECWHHAFQMGMDCTHPAIHKFIEFIRPEQNLAEKKPARKRSGEKASKTATCVKAQLGLSEKLKNY